MQALLKKLDGRGLEEVLPKWILECRDDLNTQGSNFRKFLESCNDLVYGEDKFIDSDLLRRTFTDWCYKNMVKGDAVAYNDDTLEDGFVYAERRLMGPGNTVEILPKHTRGQVWELGYDSTPGFRGISLRSLQPARPQGESDPEGQALALCFS